MSKLFEIIKILAATREGLFAGFHRAELRWALPLRNTFTKLGVRVRNFHGLTATTKDENGQRVRTSYFRIEHPWQPDDHPSKIA